jgi:PAS domain S-box-containing protein
MRGTFNRAVVLCLGLLAFLLVASALASNRNIRRLREDSQWVTHTQEVKDSLGRLLSTIREIESGQRGYVLTSDRQYLEPYNTGLAGCAAQMDRLQQLLADNSAQQELMEKLRGLIDERLKDSRRSIELMDQGNAVAARQAVEMGDGKRLMDDIRATVEEMIGDEQRLLEAREQTIDRAYSVAVSTVLLSLTMGLGMIVVSTWVLYRDLSARARAAGVIHEQREFLHATLASIGDAVITTDAAGRITFMNAVAEGLTGWKQADARGLPLQQIFVIANDRTGEPVENPALRAMSEERPVGLATTALLIARDGTERPIDDSANPIRGAKGEVAGAVLVFRDVAERERAAEDMRASEERYRTLVELIKDHAIFGMDRTGRATTWNQGVREVLGYEESEFVGREVAPLIFAPEDIASGSAELELKRAAETGSACEDRWMRRKDGTQFWASGITYSRCDAAGNAIGFIKVMRDLTERKRMEDHLHKLAADLSEADRRKDEFLATLAHELRNPLAPIRNSLEILKISEHDPSLDSVLDVMNRQLVQLVRLVDDLMDVSRITRNKLQLRLERIDLASVIRGAVETSQPLIQANGHELTLILPPEEICLKADTTRLAQVFANLLNNAAKYTERGGRIRLAVTRHDDEVVVSIQDNGIGIPKEMLSKVFDLFAQVGTTLEHAQGGLGIGLMLVRRLVEMHGGSVEARSGGPSMGSEFLVHLPVAPPLAQASAPHFEPHAPPPERRRVLIVDDNRDAADSLQRLLDLMGHDVQVVRDGLAAVEAAAEMKPDIILLDLGLPMLNGFEVCRRIRQSAEGDQIMIVAQTGWGQEEDRRRSKEAGFDFHLVKPIDSTALQKLMELHGSESEMPA